MNRIALRIVLRDLPPVPPEEGKLAVGLQDRDGGIEPGVPQADGALRFPADVGLVEKAGGFDFRGAFVHGKPGARFLYLSWKRPAPAHPPWFQRVKIPLDGLPAATLAAAAASGDALCADVTGRRPHQTTPIAWYLAGQ